MDIVLIINEIIFLLDQKEKFFDNNEQNQLD
jgi:hypothetical protein